MTGLVALRLAFAAARESSCEMVGVHDGGRACPSRPLPETPLPTFPTRRAFVAGAAASSLALSARASIFPWHFHHKKRLSNPHASPRARKLYAYLWSIYGHKTLTGQQVSAWSGPRSELDYPPAHDGQAAGRSWAWTTSTRRDGRSSTTVPRGGISKKAASRRSAGTGARLTSARAMRTRRRTSTCPRRSSRAHRRTRR